MLATFLFLAFWVVVAVSLVFIAVRGGPRARATLQSQGRTGRRAAFLGFGVFFLGVGVAVPLLLGFGDHDSASARVDGATIHLTKQELHGRQVFAQQCASCHTLAAAHAVGKVGPNFDQLKPPKALVLNAVQVGRSRGNGTMPAGLVTGPDADAVAAFVAKTAGR